MKLYSRFYNEDGELMEYKLLPNVDKDTKLSEVFHETLPVPSLKKVRPEDKIE